MRLSQVFNSSIVPSVATGAVTGAAALGYSVVDMGSKVYETAASVYAGGLLSYFSGIDLTNAADLLSHVPTKVFVGGAVIGGALGLSVAIGHEISKKILTDKEGSKEEKRNSIVSSAMIPTCITGAVGGSAVALQGVAVNQGLNIVFQRPVFGFISVAAPKIIQKAVSWTPQCVQSLAESIIEPLGFVSGQNILIGAAAGMALGVTLTVAYEVAKRAFENSSTTVKKEGEGNIGLINSPKLSPKRVTSYSA